MLKINNFTREVHPSNSATDHVFHLEDTQQILLDTVISLKSLLTSGKRGDKFISDIKYIYDNKYEYVPEVIKEVNNGKEFDIAPNHMIGPLQTIVLHFAGFLPSDLENDNKPLKFLLIIEGKQYEQIIR